VPGTPTDPGADPLGATSGARGLLAPLRPTQLFVIQRTAGAAILCWGSFPHGILPLRGSAPWHPGSIWGACLC